MNAFGSFLAGLLLGQLIPIIPTFLASDYAKWISGGKRGDTVDSSSQVSSSLGL